MALYFSKRSHQLGVDLGQLLLRASLGLIFIYHGLPKLFPVLGSQGLSGTAAGFEKMGLPLPYASALAAGCSEALGGLLLILGLFTRPAAAIMTFTMIVAVWTTRHKGFDNRTGGYEFALTLCLALAALTLTGPGRLALDKFLFGKKSLD